MTIHYTEREDVRTFHEKFGVPMATSPSFLCDKTYEFRVKFLHEELAEFEKAHKERDMEGCADALVDLAYVLHGTALMMGLPWDQLWKEVQRANMTKERASASTQSKRGCSLDVIKPAGWTGPDHMPALGTGPYPTLDSGI